MPPRAITGSAGSRIRVILGDSGTDYLHYLNEDNGDRKWQTRNWTTDSGGPPSGLCKQMNNISAKNRHITDVAFDTSGQWFVSGEKRDGTGAHRWWGGTAATVGAAIRENRDMVAFGPPDPDPDDYYDEYGDENDNENHPKCIVLRGNVCQFFGEIDADLISRMSRINTQNMTFECVRLFAKHGQPG